MEGDSINRARNERCTAGLLELSPLVTSSLEDLSNHPRNTQIIGHLEKEELKKKKITRGL